MSIMKDAELAFESIILIVVCGIPLAVVHAIDPHKKVE